MIRITDIKLKPGQDEALLYEIVSKELRMPRAEIAKIEIYKKSIDARNKSNIFYVYSLNVTAPEKYAKNSTKAQIANEETFSFYKASLSSASRPVVAGSGPAGLFCALALCHFGLNPIVLEQGADVFTRQKEIQKFSETGILNEKTNIQFGEGGAGTFSDGKLTTGTKNKYIPLVLREFVNCGAPGEILYLNKPHIGTDNLITVISNLRKKIISMGGEVRFFNTLKSFSHKNGKLTSVTVTGENGSDYQIETDTLVLATGHSARNTFEMLYKSGIFMTKKPFSVGARIEHLQEEISKTQYGDFYKRLPAADYKLASHIGQRGAYTFCMCPGGYVVAAASEENLVVTNGMSEYKRDNINANSALLVSVFPDDFPGDSPLGGMYFQRELEKKAFELGGGGYKAPAQRVADFLNKTQTQEFKNISPSYFRGVTPANLDFCLPSFVTDTMRKAIYDMDKKLHGFNCPDAILTGVETRSSSPLKILRDENGESNIKGIYPCGEGSGYAGGITTSAVDGILTANNILKKLQNNLFRR